MTTVVSKLVNVIEFKGDEKPIKKLIKNLEEARKKSTGVKRALLGLSATTLIAFQGIQKVRKDFADGFKKIGKSIKAARGSLLAFAASAAVIGKIVKDVGTFGDTVAKTARAIGTSSTLLQRLAFAADRSGTSFEGLKKGLITLQRNLLTVERTGAGPVKEALDELGLSSTALFNADAEERFRILADAFKDIENGARKSGLAAELFGVRAGPDLVNLLDAGRDEITRLGDEAERLGIVLDKGALTASEDFVDGMTNLKAAVTGVRNTIVSDYLPTITETINNIADWTAENRVLISIRVQEFIEKTVSAARVFIGTVRELVNIILSWKGVLNGIFRLLLGLVNVMGGPNGVVAAFVGFKAGLTAVSGAISLAKRGLAGLSVSFGAVGIAASVALAVVAKATADAQAMINDAIADANFAASQIRKRAPTALKRLSDEELREEARRFNDRAERGLNSGPAAEARAQTLQAEIDRRAQARADADEARRAKAEEKKLESTAKRFSRANARFTEELEAKELEKPESERNQFNLRVARRSRQLRALREKAKKKKKGTSAKPPNSSQFLQSVESFISGKASEAGVRAGVEAQARGASLEEAEAAAKAAEKAEQTRLRDLANRGQLQRVSGAKEALAQAAGLDPTTGLAADIGAQTPPTIVVNNVRNNISINAPVNVEGTFSAGAQEVANAVNRGVLDVLQDELRKGLENIQTTQLR